ncbi:DUF262 domain-containing protein [Chitinophaga flava]|uniref:DUF262 domain-containing protein n=1 Tax=Chitinophaga flava TaxID=2259036 RepID=UPI00137A72E7|nr:DUF262 domain-containing protein [Chitinophaga flava]
MFQLNNEQAHILNYKPSYQRNYVWTDVKATYLIETILLHGEIPPIVIYIKEKIWEVIDGRQRCETIDRFIRGRFSLKPQGLDKLWNLAGKKFSQLDEKLQERILNTSLRLIQIKASDHANINAAAEEIVKREIFKRYNLGISPLKKEEVFNAQYIQDEINIYFKTQFEKDTRFYSQVMDLFDHRRKNKETMMQHIRQVLVLHHIPINKFTHKREDIVNMYYDYLSYNIVNKGDPENIPLLFNNFREKCSILLEIKKQFDEAKIPSNGLIYECLFWALSVCEEEKVTIKEINNPTFKEKLVGYLDKQTQNFPLERNNLVEIITKRYNLVANFFTSQLNVSFVRYLRSDDEFLVTHKEKMHQYMAERFAPGKEQEHFSKMDPTSTSVSDILDRIKRGKFKIKPAYQRSEVMNITKASSLIESILLGIKIHPLYIYVRKDGVAEVIDGQQRLLTMIGFLGERYTDEKGKMVLSKKNNFELNLRTGLLPHLHKKKFRQLSEEEQSCIRNFDLEVIEIKEENNKHFLPEELFKRINHKPFPIKENTFECWNAYVDSEIIEAIKDTYKRNNWLYLRKDDKRMLNEELVTSLCYLHYMTTGEANLRNIKEILEINKRQSAAIVKFKTKANITRVLENPAFKAELLLALNDFEAEFIEKMKLLISKPTGKSTESISSKRLDAILQTGSVRVSMSFYLLWVLLKGLPIEYLKEDPSTVQRRIMKVFSMLRTYESAEKIEAAIKETWSALPVSLAN